MRTLFLLMPALLLFLSGCAARPGVSGATVTPVTLAGSREGRAIHARTYGVGPRRVYLIASIHGDEPEGLESLASLERRLAIDTGDATVRLVRDMNPDGSVAGTRTNAAGVDLNRNWPAANFRAGRGRGAAPLSEPETATVHADILAFDPHVIIVLHSARGGPFVNYDGPPTAGVLAERFSAGARSAGDGRWRSVADMGYPTPGSMGSYFGKDRGVPILTVELRRGEDSLRAAAPLGSGLRAVLTAEGVALTPLSRAAPSVRVARQEAGGLGSSVPPAE